MRHACLSALLLTAFSGVSLAQRPPNVILFYADDLGFGDVGFNGCRDIRTPHIDALAKSGIRFTNYYAAAPICAPSRAGLMTGRYPMRIGMSSQTNIASGLEVGGIPGTEVTVAELAKSKGYATALFGKWHLGSTKECDPNAQGFDEFFGFLGSCVDSFSHMYYASEPWYHDLFHNREEVYEDGVHMTDLITREGLRFIDKNKDRPFLLYLAYNVPHYPMVPQSRFLKGYENLPTERRILAAMITGMDDSIGQIVKSLRSKSLLDNTFIFFASDNGAPSASKRGEGGGSNAPLREYKKSLFDGGMHCPAMISFPGRVEAGQARNQLAACMDVFPTVAEVIGAPLPTGVMIDGQSWRPLFKDAAAPGHEHLFFEWANQHAVRQDKWKFVQNGLIDLASGGRNNRAKGPDAIFLSDVDTDEGEKSNQREKQPELVKTLEQAHRDWLKQFPSTQPQ